MNFPENLRYTKDHEWVKVDGNIATIGITDFAQGELGDVIYLDLHSSGDVAVHGSLGTIEAVKTVSDIYTPVAGRIKEANTSLNDAPETVNKDPYGEGWLIKIDMSNPSEAQSNTMSATEYKALVVH